MVGDHHLTRRVVQNMTGLLSIHVFDKTRTLREYERCVYNTSGESKADNGQDIEYPVKSNIRKKRTVILSDDEDEGLGPSVIKEQVSSPKHSHLSDEGQYS